MTITRHERRPGPVHDFAPPAPILHRTEASTRHVSRTDAHERPSPPLAHAQPGGFGAEAGRRCGESFQRGAATERGGYVILTRL